MRSNTNLNVKYWIFFSTWDIRYKSTWIICATPEQAIDIFLKKYFKRNSMRMIAFDKENALLNMILQNGEKESYSLISRDQIN